MNAALDTISVTTLRGVGAETAKRLDGLGIRSVQDVLFHLPFRYQDRTRLTPIAHARPGEEVLVSVEVLDAEVVFRRRRSLLVRVTDRSGFLTLRFFHFSQAQQRTLRPGQRLHAFGELRRGPGQLEIVHPEYTLLREGDSDEDALRDELTPFYPGTEGVQQGTLRRLSEQALARLDKGSLADYLPEPLSITSAAGTLELPALSAALSTVHRPSRGENTRALLDGLHPAIRRLAFEELVAHRLALREHRQRTLAQQAPVIRARGELSRPLRDALGFSLTAAQDRVLLDIVNDMGSGAPMLRLVQGDVGSGKTVVAALAAAQAVECGYQVALMAPTEILAEQHMLGFLQWFEPLGVSVGWLSGRLTPSKRRAAIEAVAMGQHPIVVGTHALFQEDVSFQKLGLAIIDEQHRFGVHQRLALRNKGATGRLLPHQLIMTATPIPRSLAMTAYADLDVSVIDELPPGRRPVTTIAVDNARRAEVVERVAAALREGQQVYWVCTLVEESESLQAEAAEETLRALTEAIPDRRIGLVHGRMKGREKEAVMQAFKARELDLLVATTVIEVGVDVPNASCMIIDNAERLGLSQLHQLRGRVGRGSAQSTCILLYQAPLSETAHQRIGIMRETNDGFTIAETDMRIRGAGEVLGTRQTGLAGFRLADLMRDADLLDAVGEMADRLALDNPDAVAGLIRRWVGEENREYGGV
ncbi:MAG: ATP-dependent DNA helicase RecG [Gammaproteobacteria bacterium]|nr:MAG: ATP-dependent DNA helicase RecG [Gammaproteobacteria bacterium]PIE35731.1 MAG: ATP-dependent DNA helicase RecG [Gammaproteobacteria bacterium]